MGKGNFSDAFKRGAVAQITERGYPVAEVSERLGVSTYSLYPWKKRFVKAGSGDARKDAEVRRLQKERLRVTEELKKPPRISPGMPSEIRVHYEHRRRFPVRTMCRCLCIHSSGFYAWL